MRYKASDKFFMNGPEKKSLKESNAHKENAMAAQSAMLKLLEKLFQDHRARGKSKTDREAIATVDLNHVCQALDLQACGIFLPGNSDGTYEVSAVSKKSGSSSNKSKKPLACQIASGQDLSRLLQQGQHVFLNKSIFQGTKSGEPIILDNLQADSKRKSAFVVFPLSAILDQILGLMILEKATGDFNDSIIQQAALVAKLISTMLLDNQSSTATLKSGAGNKLPGLIQDSFATSLLPTVILDFKTRHILELNPAAKNFFKAQGKSASANKTNAQLKNLMPRAKHFLSSLDISLSRSSNFKCYSVSSDDLQQYGVSAVLVSISEDQKIISLQFISSNLNDDNTHETKDKLESTHGARNSDTTDTDDQQSELSIDDLSRRLGHERWLRQVICKMHASLDRDHLLQSIADSLGRAFKVTRCLIIRIEGAPNPHVTHEYVDPELSPLGLGRTTQFPVFAIKLFDRKTRSYPDINELEGKLSEGELELLKDNGIRSMTGGPLIYQNTVFGVVLMVDNGKIRTFKPEELELLDAVLSQASVALNHVHAFHQVKDQLFHMSLLANLTQQLTTALEVAAKSPPPRADEKPSFDNNSEAAGLSTRELEVLRFIATGLTNKEIAKKMFLTESTVELHASRIRKKLNQKSRTALVKYACEHGLA